MQYFTCPFEIKSDNSNDGTIFGYGSTFDNIDSYGDTIAPGAFKQSINDAMTGAKAWPAMLLQHGGPTATDKTPIGVWTDMSEDDKGLKLTGRLAIKTRRGSEAYELLKMKPRPALNGLSIGFRAKDYTLHKVGSPARHTLKEIELVEVSLVTFPADQYARVIGVKAQVETAPVFTMRDLARADYDRLCRTITANNRNWR